MTRTAFRSPACVALLAMLCACGKRGNPLPPLHLVPEPPSSITARRVGGTVYVQMVAPNKNANAPGTVALDRIEIFGVTVGAGMAPPANRALLTSTYRAGEIAIKPPVDEDEPVEEVENDPRPGPGDKVTFAEPLTDKQLEPAPGLKPLPPAPAPAAPAAATPATTTEPAEKPATPATTPPAGAADATPTAGQAPLTAPGASATPTGPVRVYIARGVTKSGRPGPPSARVSVPLVPPPPPPGSASASFTERAVTITWLPPVAPLGAAPALTFNVYAVKSSTPSADAPAPPVPLNEAPLEATTFERPGIEPGVEACFQVRTVEKVGDLPIESDPSAPICVTPRDVFAPAPPKGLALVAMEGGIMNLIWDANTEADLAGYLVLRGEAPGDRLQPLTPEPIRETSFRDTTVTPGVRYVYVIVAVDRATPPNRSAPSARVEETAR